MNLEGIKKLVKKHVPQERVWRSNINGDFDYFTINTIQRGKGVPKGYVNLTTSIGFARYGTWTKFDIKIYNGATRDEVLYRIQSYVEYYHKCNGSAKAYAEGFAAHIKATGGHSGNPVWMD